MTRKKQIMQETGVLHKMMRGTFFNHFLQTFCTTTTHQLVKFLGEKLNSVLVGDCIVQIPGLISWQNYLNFGVGELMNLDLKKCGVGEQLNFCWSSIDNYSLLSSHMIFFSLDLTGDLSLYRILLSKSIVDCVFIYDCISVFVPCSSICSLESIDPGSDKDFDVSTPCFLSLLCIDLK